MYSFSQPGDGRTKYVGAGAPPLHSGTTGNVMPWEKELSLDECVKYLVRDRTNLLPSQIKRIP